MGKLVSLTRRRDFERLFSQGRRYHHQLLTTVVLAREDSSSLRAAFITGRKVGKAVVRNKTRRRLREAWRRFLDEINQPADVAFVAQPATAAASYAQLTAVMAEHLGQAGLMKCR